MQLSHRFALIWTLFALLMAALLALALPLGPAPSVESAGGDEDAILALVDRMIAAVLAQNVDAYLACVDLSDPVFAREQTYWANDWTGPGRVSAFEMVLSDLDVQGDSATADLLMHWTLFWDTRTQSAEYPVRFRHGTDGTWRYTGEAWTTQEIDGFRVHTFPGTADAVEPLAESLPGIYAHVTRSLDYEPSTTIEIKLYGDPAVLTAVTALSLPPIRGWNEPGESLKILVEPGSLPSDGVLAHELTHFVTFDMAGTTRGNYPWWVMEGIAQYISSDYWEDDLGDDRLAQVRAWQAENTLGDWEQMEVYETTPREMYGYVYNQGYAFVRFVTETYGPEARNAWLWGMAGDLDLDGATQAALGLSFEDASRAFEDWLAVGELAPASTASG